MTVNKWLLSTLILGLMEATALADCTLPPAPTKIPDGQTAAEQEMMAAMSTLKQYDADVNAYLKCLEFEAKQNRLSRDEQTQRHNSAVDGLQSVASKFNEQVRIFKSKG